LSDRVQRRGKPAIPEEVFRRSHPTRFGGEREDRRAEKRVAEICDGILRRLSELQSGELETGLPGRRSWKRRSE